MTRASMPALPVLPSRLVLLGHPVAHSLSPRFQGAALRAAGLALQYHALDVPPDDLAQAVGVLRAEGAAGNVTIPHKVAMRALCDRVTPVADRAGAVNTFWMEDGALLGDNTDVGGFEHAARLLVDPMARPLVVGMLGAGGAAAAVLTAIERWPGASALVHNRGKDRLAPLLARFSHASAADDAAAVVSAADFVVNATSIGLHDDQMPLDPALLRPGVPVLDLVYRRGQTALVRAVRARGHAADDGLGMLLEQGALAFERWTGLTPDRRAMREALAD
jgi:shikimate dehydrogenase